MGSKEEYERLRKPLIEFLKICEVQKGWGNRTDSYRNGAQFLTTWINHAKSLWNAVVAEESLGTISSSDKNKLRKWISELEAIFNDLLSEMLSSPHKSMNPSGFQKFFDKSSYIRQYMGYIGTKLGVKGAN